MDWNPLGLSALLAVLVTSILLALVFPLAWWLGKTRNPLAPVVESVATLPLVLPPTVLGFYILVTLSPHSPFGAWLDRVWGVRLVFTFPGILLAACVTNLPFMTRALKAGVEALDPTWLDASATLGKSRLQTILLVALPNMKGALFAGAVTTFAHTMGEFGVVLMVGGSIPGQTRVLSIALLERVEALDFAAAHAYAAVMVALNFVAIFTLTLFQKRQARRDS